MLTRLLVILALATPAAAAEPVEVVRDDSGWKLLVGGEPYLVKGVNWRYTPVGRKYDFNACIDLPRPVAERLIDEDAAQMKRMGVNTIRLIDESGRAVWAVRRFHEKHGIRTILNHFAGRYGATVDGEWIYPTNYADPATREAILTSAAAVVERYRDVPGVVAYAFGNEGNYGLEWVDQAVGQLPEGERQAAKARHLYALLNEVCRRAGEIDPDRPAMIVNGDLQYLDLIAELCPDVDILGINAYRGRSFGDLWQRAAEIDKPVVLIEFGADAFNARSGEEDEAMQADFLDDVLTDVGGHAHPDLGGTAPPSATSALGGCLFQWVDEWWKHGNDVGLDEHDTAASWANPAYPDFAEGENNMNEEWWGLCALSPAPDADGLHARRPRAACETVARHWAE